MPEPGAEDGPRDAKLSEIGDAGPEDDVEEEEEDDEEEPLLKYKRLTGMLTDLVADDDITSAKGHRTCLVRACDALLRRSPW